MANLKSEMQENLKENSSSDSYNVNSEVFNRKIDSFKFCSNISTMFSAMPVYKRLFKAESLGFSDVEAQFLYDCDRSSLVKAREETKLKFVLINSPWTMGDTKEIKDVFGLACIPDNESEFKLSIERAKIWAEDLLCSNIHVIAGNIKPDSSYTYEDYHKAYVRNIQWAAKFLEKSNIVVLIEPMSGKENYFLKSFDQAVQIIEEVNCPNLKLLLDVYHMHRMGMNLEEDIPKYLTYTGHIQVSQSPDRYEFSYPGEINYRRVFEILDENCYSDYVGLECFPSGDENWVDKHKV